MIVPFYPDDHVTEREVGPWRDCTFAAMLETLRLGLLNGQTIPPTIIEKERFRAEAGLPDDHPGATIGDTIPAAKRLYGLTNADYILTRDFDVLTLALENPSIVCVVTGLMASVPASERITSFIGAHAVAKHGVRIRCDPLGPRDGKYQGNTWPILIWREFTAGLGDNWQAFIMTARGGGNMSISASGIIITSNKRVRVIHDTGILEGPGGPQIALAKGPPAGPNGQGYIYPYLGTTGGWREVLVDTAIPYLDGKIRSTHGLFLAPANVVIEDVQLPSSIDTGPAVEAKWEAWVATHP